jgi:ComF family protein
MLTHILNGLVQLAYPQLCSGCGGVLMKQELYFCLHCSEKMPYTAISDMQNNEIMRRLTARVPIVWAYGLLFFQKKSLTQNILHDIKYNNHKDLALYMGGIIGEQLKSKIAFEDSCIVVPVPLHLRKKRQRGYNQSALIGNGIADKLNISIKENVLERNNYRESQTHKHRSERWELIQHDFFVRQKDEIYKKNVILVDDIFTTGATAEVCVNTLLEAGVNSVAVVTLAIAVN